MTVRPDAALKLGRLLLSRGGARDIVEAPDFIKKAADAGITDACPADYAILLDEGKYLPENAPLAAEYYASAATAGRLPAQLRLAELYSGDWRLPMIRKPDLTGC